MGIDIRVEPAVELFCVIYRLAQMDQYTVNKLPKYVKKIEEHFGSFANHPAVDMAVSLRANNRINGSAPMALAVYLNPPPQLIPRNDLNPLPHDLDPRWKPDIINEFIDAARLFAKDTRFMDFYNSQLELYSKSVQSLTESLREEDLLTWFTNYFGYQPGKYSIVVGMQTGNGNYGLQITNMDGVHEYISIIGANSPSFWDGIPRFSFWWFIPTVVHEFCHSYINPLVDKYDNLFRESGESMYPYHEAKLRPLGYSSYQIMMHEYLVRACTIRYLYSKQKFKQIDKRLEIDEEQGFPIIRGLVDLLEEFESNRVQYKTLEEFIPEIADYFDTYALSLK